MVGGAWAGSVLGGGFRGEFLVSKSPGECDWEDDVVLHDSGGSVFASGNPVVSFVLSADYAFANSFYIHSECLFNSNGKEENAGDFWHRPRMPGCYLLPGGLFIRKLPTISLNLPGPPSSAFSIPSITHP